MIASVSGLNVARREIVDSLDACAGDVLWIVNAYTLGLAEVLIPIGAVDNTGWGRRPVLLSGLEEFTIASFAAGRTVGRGDCDTGKLSVITPWFPPEERHVRSGSGQVSPVSGAIRDGHVAVRSADDPAGLKRPVSGRVWRQGA